MIYSMTGYGSAKGTVDALEISVELKSVNNRYLDTSVRLPRSFIFAEEGIKAQVQRHISRGKVDVFVNVDSSKADDVVITVNETLAREYAAAFRRIGEVCGMEDKLTAADIGRFPEVLSVEKREADKEIIFEGISAIMEQALNEFDAMRSREGAKLAEDILSRVAAIEEMTGYVEKRSPETVADYRARLEQRMREVLETVAVDDARLMTEAAIFADKIAVDEETVRLRSHFEQLRGMLENGSPVGRKLDFLIQEFNRETNTIGSKCSDRLIAAKVVDMKAEIEKIREQIQNIE
ncbi:MAG: YicC/YloC family endoribonuclease [Candidatus Heteroscillospira sp.]|jgi:uncharacterized protein (TIGR00255 family)